VVDDYEPWRRFVTSTLEKQPELQIIGEASDGREAVEMAQQLYPDLILLDIGLPIVNGLEAARQIRKHAPDTKILFLSENRSAAIAESALSIGASGYVVKAKAATDLVTALKTVLEGKRFVSASLVGHEAGNPTSKHTADKNALVHLPPRNVEIRHEVEFYPDDAAFVAGFAGCIAAVLQAGNSVIVIATEPHRSGILERLEADGVDIRTPAEQERFIELDAHEALSTLMSDDAPDRVRLTKLLDDLVARAAKGRDGEHPRVAICGECAPILLADGKEEAAIQVEHLWDTISKAHRVDTLCGYLRSAFPQAASSPMLEKICAEHSAVHGRKLGY
jgi:DNA-binding NarL/FixJ family response regulator